MKAVLPYIGLAILAGLVVGLQPLIIYGMDDFSVTPDSRKVFTYGFPFPVHDSPASSAHTPAQQVPLRLAGDFVVWFSAGTAVLAAIRFTRARGQQTQL